MKTIYRVCYAKEVNLKEIDYSKRYNEEILFMSDDYSGAKRFFDAKVKELKEDHSLEYAYSLTKSDLVYHTQDVSFLDTYSREHSLSLRDDMYYHEGLLHYPGREVKPVLLEKII